MLYGETFRQGVYLLQKAFKELGLKQNEEDISIAREIIRALPERHSVMPYIRYAHELAYDAAFVDTFLNPVDRAYSVEGIFDLLDRAELEFISWQDPLVYDHRAYFQNLESLSKLLINKSDRERYAIVEKLTYARGAHYFNVCKKNFALLRVKPDVSKSFENVYPKVRAGIKAIKPATKISGGNAVLQRSFIRFEISFKQAQVLQMCNGENTVGEISNALNVPLQELDIFIKDMYSFGHLLIRC
jgi:hypothetical protein